MHRRVVAEAGRKPQSGLGLEMVQALAPALANRSQKLTAPKSFLRTGVLGALDLEFSGASTNVGIFLFCPDQNSPTGN